MKTDGIRMVSILAVLLLLSTGMACVLTDDDSSAFSFPSNSASNPLTSFNYSAFSEITHGTYTVYIAVGSSFLLEGYYDDSDGSCSDISAPGCEQYGLSKVGDDLRGTISKAGSLTVSVDNEGVGTLNGNNDTTLYLHFVNNTPTNYTHRINYSSGGGSGSMSSSIVTDTNSGYSSVQLKSNGFTRSGYHFTGWYVDGSYKSPGDYVSVRGNSSVTATAQWEQDVVYYSHTIYYNSNGGSGSMSSTSTTNTTSGTTYLTLKSNEFTRSGYHFTGWKIGSTIYQPGQTVGVSGNSSVTAYAQWEQNTYTATLNFNANGGSGAPSSQTYTGTSTSSHTFTIPSITPTRSGYEFKGWSESSSATSASYQPGSTISVSYNGTKTLYAVWAQTYTHTINYNSNGGSGSMSPTTKTDTSSSSSVPLANNGFTKTGYHFVGWKINNTGTTYQPGQSVSVGTSVTAYAQWEQNTISLNAIDTQYAVVGKSVSFNASASSNPSGASITFSKSNVPSGLSVSISGSTITCSSSTTGTFTFTLTASATNYQSDSRTVTVEFVPALAFTNSPLIGVIGS